MDAFAEAVEERRMTEVRYRLIYEGDIIADNIAIDTAIILIKGLCEKYFNEGTHSFQLIVIKAEEEE